MTDKRPGSNAVYILLIVLLLAVIGVLAVLLLRRGGDDGQIVTGGNRDPNANLGQYEGKTQAEIQAELDKIVAEGMFNISVNSAVTMASGRDEAELRIENIQANRHLMRVAVSLDDTGEVLYTSGLIEPGYYIQSVPLDVTLAKGQYAATAVFTAYDPETETLVGQAAAKITITVQQ